MESIKPPKQLMDIIENFNYFEQFLFRPGAPDFPATTDMGHASLGYRHTNPDTGVTNSYYILLEHGDDGSWITHADLFNFRAFCCVIGWHDDDLENPIISMHGKDYEIKQLQPYTISPERIQKMLGN